MYKRVFNVCILSKLVNLFFQKKYKNSCDPRRSQTFEHCSLLIMLLRLEFIKKILQIVAYLALGTGILMSRNAWLLCSGWAHSPQQVNVYLLGTIAGPCGI